MDNIGVVLALLGAVLAALLAGAGSAVGVAAQVRRPRAL